MKVLVTGGAGYIGSITVAELIRAGHEVMVFDNLEKGHEEALDLEQVELVVGDLRERADIEAAVEQNPIDVCVHFAAFCAAGESVEKPAEYFENNFIGSLNLFRALIRSSVLKVVFSSTCAVYGQPQSLPVKEGDLEEPESPYGESKLMVEKMLKWFYNAYGLNSISLRYFNAAGAALDGALGEDKTPVTVLISAAMQAALGKTEEFILNGGDYPTPDGTCVRDYIHVLDLADAHIKALEKLSGGFDGAAFYNCGAGEGYSNLQIIEKVKAVSGADFAVRVGPRRPGDPAEIYADNAKIKKELGWQPRYGLNEIVHSAWQWHSTHPRGYL